MALGTVTHVKQGVFGDLRYVIADVRPTAGANYATGGEPFAAAQLSRTGTLLAVIVVGSTVDATNKTFLVWDAANKKLVAYNQTAGTDVGLIEVAANTDLSGESHRLLCLLK